MAYSAAVLRKVPAAVLANQADITLGESGIQYVSDVLGRVEEAIENDEFDTYPEDTISEIADSLLPVYNRGIMQELSALQCWDEDIEDYGPFEDLLGAATASLYIAYERLVATALELSEVEDEEEDDVVA